MRERQLIDAIHRRLPKSLHRQSMTLGSLTQNGTPDYYYDGPKSDLWVEYKQAKVVPRNGFVVPKLTELQRRWLVRRHEHGHNAVVVVGLPNRLALVLNTPSTWASGGSDMAAIDYNEIAKWICDFCGCSFDRAAR